MSFARAAVGRNMTAQATMHAKFTLAGTPFSTFIGGALHQQACMVLHQLADGTKSETIANTDEGEKIPPFAPRKMGHPARPLYLKALWRSRESELPRKFRSLLQWTIHKRSEQTRVPKGSAVGNARDRGP